MSAAQGGFEPILWALSLRGGLTLTTKAVLLALARYANTKGQCFPTVDTIAADARISVRAAQFALRDLEASGFISVAKGVGRGHRSEYLLNISSIKGEPDAPIEPMKGERHAPFKASNGERHAPFNGAGTPEKVNLTTVKGEPDSPRTIQENYPREVSKHTPTPQRALVPRLPTVSAFDLFWDFYPRKMARGAAEAEYARVIAGGADPAELLDAVQRKQWPAETRFIPAPARWLREQRWRDDEGGADDDVLRAAGLANFQPTGWAS